MQTKIKDVCDRHGFEHVTMEARSNEHGLLIHHAKRSLNDEESNENRNVLHVVLFAPRRPLNVSMPALLAELQAAAPDRRIKLTLQGEAVCMIDAEIYQKFFGSES